MKQPIRKSPRLPHFDYSRNGAYFITICTQHRQKILSHIVGDGALDVPRIELTNIGKIVEKYILSCETIRYVFVKKYVIMPNHIHIIFSICHPHIWKNSDKNGTSKAPSPTNEVIPHIVSTLKRFCNAEIGKNIFQRSYHDHIIRGEMDYIKIWEYIENNPRTWENDCFYDENPSNNEK